jgi:hypothetical protein
VAGAISPGEVEMIFTDLGFKEISIDSKEKSEEIIREWAISKSAEKIVFSAYIKAVKPG